MKPGIYRGRDVGLAGIDPTPEPFTDLIDGARIQLTERSYLRVALDPHTGELALHASGTGMEHILFRPAGGINTAGLRIELRTGSHYLGQAPEPINVQATRERTLEIDQIRLALQNAGTKGAKRSGLTADEARSLGDRLHQILTERSEAE